MTSFNKPMLYSHPLARTFSKKNQKNDQEDIEAEEIDFELIEMQYEELVDEFNDTLSRLKFGSLSPEVIEDLEVRAYGDYCLMIELAQVIPKNDRTALLNVYDPSVLNDVKTCLDLCDLDLTIQKDPQGFLVTLTNANSREARLQFAQSVKEKGYEYTKKLRNIRRDEIKEIKALAKSGGFGEDFIYDAQEEVHNMYLKSNKEVETAMATKLASVGL